MASNIIINFAFFKAVSRPRTCWFLLWNLFCECCISILFHCDHCSPLCERVKPANVFVLQTPDSILCVTVLLFAVIIIWNYPKFTDDDAKLFPHFNGNAAEDLWGGNDATYLMTQPLVFSFRQFKLWPLAYSSARLPPFVRIFLRRSILHPPHPHHGCLCPAQHLCVSAKHSHEIQWYSSQLW